MSSNLPSIYSSVADAATAVTSAISANTGNFNYLKLEKSGTWVHGADEEEIAENSIFVIDPATFVSGFSAWDDGELLGEEYQLITEGAVDKSSLEQGLPWKPLFGFQLKCVNGDDKGLALFYKTTSIGGTKAYNEVLKHFVAKVNDPDNNGYILPVVRLDTDSYKHNRYGKIYTPIFEIVRWDNELPEDDTPQQSTPAIAQAPDNAPDSALEPEQPKRRRRRRA